MFKFEANESHGDRRTKREINTNVKLRFINYSHSKFLSNYSTKTNCLKVDNWEVKFSAKMFIACHNHKTGQFVIDGDNPAFGCKIKIQRYQMPIK